LGRRGDFTRRGKRAETERAARAAWVSLNPPVAAKGTSLPRCATRARSVLARLRAGRQHDERDDVLLRLERRAVRRRRVLRREGADAHAIPRTAPRDVRLEGVRFVPARAELIGELPRFGLAAERAHLKLIAAVVT